MLKPPIRSGISLDSARNPDASRVGGRGRADARPIPTVPDRASTGGDERGSSSSGSSSDHGGDQKEKTSAEKRPTQFSSEITRIAQNESGARLIAKIVRELLQQGRYAQSGDLRDDVEQRCRALGLDCSREQVERALELVGSNRQLLTANRRPVTVPAPAPPEPAGITPAEARAILDRMDVSIAGGRLQRRGGRSRLVPL